MVSRVVSLALLLLSTLVPGALASDRFSLDVPGQPGLQSSAEVDTTALVITDATGRSYTYIRDKNADSRDGSFWGYYNADLRRYIRFPTAGTGAMQTSEKGGSRVWRTSKMQVTRMASRGNRATTPVQPVYPPRPVQPGLDPFAPGRPRPGSPAQGGHHSFRASHFAVLPSGADFHVGALDRRGEFQFYFGRGTEWRKQTAQPVRGIDFDGSFVLAPNPRSAIPTVYGISTRGELLAITDGRDVRSVFGNRRDAPRFVRDTQLSTFDDGRLVLAVDDRGRCLVMTGADGRLADAGPYRSRALPGSPVYATRDSRNVVHAFLIDDGGQLVQLSRNPTGSWDERALGGGYSPGGYLSVDRLQVAGRDTQVYLASVNDRGTVQILREPFRRAITVDSLRLTPGAPLTLTHKRGGQVAFAAIDRRGSLAEWVYEGQWVRQDIGVGFSPGAPVWFHGGVPACFAINQQGALIAGHFFANRWACHTCGTVSGLVGYVAPRVVRSEVVALPGLPPVEIRLQNRHQEDLVVQWVDALKAPGRPESIEIPAGATVRRQINRDGGAKRVDTVAVQRIDGTIVEEIREYAIPPQSLYTLGVFENRIQSVYIDRTGKDPTPGSVTKGLRSLGVFRLPPGDLMADGAVIDVFGEAASRNNPGAVRLLP